MEIVDKRQARLAYLKAYRTAHAERIAAQKKAWFEANKERCQERNKNNYQANKAKYTELNKLWIQANPNKTAEYAKAFKLRHPERVTLERQTYKKNNKGVVNANTRKRQAAKLHRTPNWLTEDDLWLMQQAYDLAQLRSTLFGFPWHVDHVLPLQGKYVSGLHVPANVQVIPGVENSRKNNNWRPT